MIFKIKKILLSTILVLSIFPSIINADDDNGSFSASYSPPFIPVVITISEDGVDISASGSVVTPWGTFSAGYDYNLKKFSSKDLILIIRNRKSWGDKVYKIKNGNELSVFMNGSTLVETKNGKVIIDVTNTHYMKIQFSKDRPLNNNIVIPVALKVLSRKKIGDRFSIVYNQKSLEPSSKLRIVAKTNKKSYLYVFHIKENGSSYRLFPMWKLGKKILNNTNPINSRKNIYLPSYDGTFELEKERSNDSLYFICLKEADKILESKNFSIMKNDEELISYINLTYGKEFNKLYFSIR